MFLSRNTNALDAKGRVSVPADFRTVIAANAVNDAAPFDGIVVWPSFDGAYLEGGSMALLYEYQALLDNMDPYDDARIAIEHGIFAESRRLSFDSNGRVSLPKEFAEHAELNGQVAFIGLGRRFEIWSPDKYKAHSLEVRRMARESRHRLRLVGRPNPPSVSPSAGASS